MNDFGKANPFGRINEFYIDLIAKTVLVLLVIGILVTVYLSWKSDPDLSGIAWIPKRLSGWGDLGENSRRRTAVPFFVIGFGVGVLLILKRKMNTLSFLFNWLLLVFFVTVLEAVQFLIPTRFADFKDVCWGAIGAGVGLGLTYLAWSFYRKFGIKVKSIKMS